MKFGSVCSGIEAASTAWEPLGWTASWFAEIEPFPCAVLAHHWPDTPNLGDFTSIRHKIASGDLEAPDVLVGGTPCFVAGHMVLTAKGYRPIESLTPGDLVVTHTGKLCPIVRTGSKQAQVGKMSLVGRPEGITCTADHPFLSTTWKAQNTKRDNKYARIETCTEPAWTPASEMPGKQWCSLVSVPKIHTEIKSTKYTQEQAMYLAGMYLGDGWIRGWTGETKKAVILGLNEAKYKKFLSVNQDAVHTVSRECTTVKVQICDTQFANWLEDNFGCGSSEKTLPAWVLGHDLRHLLLQGYLDTDGHVSGHKESVSTVSRSLAYGLADLMSTLDRVPSVARVDTPDTCVIEGRTVNQKDYFQVRANPVSISRKARTAHGLLMRKVQSWEPCGTAIVHNIEVSGDNSYILDGAIVHNCQAFSVAGLRKSLDDQRGQLTIQFVGLADAIDDRRRDLGLLPAIIVWENVPGVLNTPDNAFGCFLAAVAGNDAPLVPPGGRWTDAGFVRGPRRSLAWRVQDAQYHGLAQRRRRVFLVASAREGFRPEQILFEFDGVRRDSPPCREPREGAAPNASEGSGSVPSHWGGVAPCLEAQGVSTGQYMSNPQARVLEGYSIPLKCSGAEGANGAGIGSIGDPCPTLDTTGAQGVGYVPATSPALGARDYKGTPQDVQEPAFVSYAIQERAVSTNPAAGPQGKGFQPDLGYTLEARHHVQAVAFSEGFFRCGSGHAPTTDGKVNTLTTNTGDQRISVAFAQNTRDEVRLQAGDGSIVGSLAAEPGMKQTSYVAIGTDMYNGSITGDVAATMTKTSGTGTGSGPTPLALNHTQAMQVRRLTPEECERLQGFPVGHTRIPWRGKAAEDCPDGPRYKALGNSMAVPCMAWIAKRIIRHIAGEI